MPATRSPTTPPEVGSSTMSAPLRNAAPGQRREAGGRTRSAGHPLDEQVGAQQGEPEAGQSHEEQRELRREPQLHVGGRHLCPVTCLARGAARTPGRQGLPTPSAPSSDRGVAPKRVERIQRLSERIHRDDLEIVSDGRFHLFQLVCRHQKHLIPGISDSDGLLRSSADGSDGAVERSSCP